MSCFPTPEHLRGIPRSLVLGNPTVNISNIPSFSICPLRSLGRDLPSLAPTSLGHPCRPSTHSAAHSRHTCSFQAGGHPRPYLDARSVPGPGVSSLTQLPSRSTHGAMHPLAPPGPGDPLMPPWTPSWTGWVADPSVGQAPCSASLAPIPAELVTRAVAVTHPGSHRWGRAASPFQAATQPNQARGAWGRRGLGPADTALTNERLQIAPRRRGPWPMG